MPTLPLIVAPSLLAADFARLADEIAAMEAAGADWLHLDVMDGHFVPNISFGAPVIGKLRALTTMPFDVHLMIEPVDPLLDSFVEAGANHILVHAEAGPHLHRSLQTIKGHGLGAGVVLCPATPAAHVETVLDLVDIILVMTVNPGFGGQEFLTSQLAKIEALRGIIDRSGKQIRLEVDGGIDHATARLARDAGADTLVAGSSLFGQKDYKAAIASLRS